jgi:hypothetical protein
MSHTERTKYLTDLTDKQWQIRQRLLPPRSRRGAPQRICRRGVLNAIIYVVRSGCPWRLLPHEFRNWKTVYGIFVRWRNDRTWQRIPPGGPPSGSTSRFFLVPGLPRSVGFGPVFFPPRIGRCPASRRLPTTSKRPPRVRRTRGPAGPRSSRRSRFGTTARTSGGPSCHRRSAWGAGSTDIRIGGGR